MRALLVHNPSAGSGHPDRDELLGLLERAGFSARYLSSKDDAFKEALERPDAEIVIVAGGDGTVSKVARTISDRTIPLAILPLGTANNVARALNITGDIERLAEGLRAAPMARLDVGCAAGPWGEWNFLESVGWGALAKVVDIGVAEATRDEKIAKGRELFAEIIEQAKPRFVRLEIDGRQIEGAFVFVEILNIGITGPRVMISPTAEPGDRLLDIVYLPAARKQAMIDWLHSAPDHTPIPLEEIKGRKVTFLWNEGPLRVDDTVFDGPEMPSQVHAEIEPEALRVCVPRRDL